MLVFVPAISVGQLAAGGDMVCACRALGHGAPHILQTLPLLIWPFLQSLPDPSAEA